MALTDRGSRRSGGHITRLRLTCSNQRSHGFSCSLLTPTERKQTALEGEGRRLCRLSCSKSEMFGFRIKGITANVIGLDFGVVWGGVVCVCALCVCGGGGEGGGRLSAIWLASNEIALQIMQRV